MTAQTLESSHLSTKIFANNVRKAIVLAVKYPKVNTAKSAFQASSDKTNHVSLALPKITPAWNASTIISVKNASLDTH